MTPSPNLIMDLLDRLEGELDVQAGRVGLLGRWLDDHDQRLDALSAKMKATRSRIDALIAADPR